MNKYGTLSQNLPTTQNPERSSREFMKTSGLTISHDMGGTCLTTAIGNISWQVSEHGQKALFRLKNFNKILCHNIPRLASPS
jgi:hypothetical protein